MQDPTKATKTYQGVHFGKYSSKRLDLSKGRMGPGPGDYEPYSNVQNKAENLNAIEESTRFEARIPRYHEAIVKDEEKKVSISGIYSSFLKIENIQIFFKNLFFLFPNYDV